MVGVEEGVGEGKVVMLRAGVEWQGLARCTQARHRWSQLTPGLMGVQEDWGPRLGPEPSRMCCWPAHPPTSRPGTGQGAAGAHLCTPLCQRNACLGWSSLMGRWRSSLPSVRDKSKIAEKDCSATALYLKKEDP